MTSPKYANTTESGRYYTLPGYSQQMKSVTSILNVIAAPALIAWSARSAAECAVQGENMWHAVQDAEGDDAAISFIKEAGKRYMHERAEVGTAVHHACERYTLRDEWTDDETVKPYLEAYVRWVERDNPSFIEVEQTVFDPEMGYAGTADMIVRLGDKTYIGDIKTGFVADKAAIQMAAYARATHRVQGNKSTLVPWEIDGAFVLDLKPGKFSVRYCDIGTNTWRAFRAAMALSEFEERKDVFGAKWR